MKKPLMLALITALLAVLVIGCTPPTQVPPSYLGAWTGNYVSGQKVIKLANGNWQVTNLLNNGTVRLSLTSDWHFTGTLTDVQGRTAAISGMVDRTTEVCSVTGSQPPAGALWAGVNGTLGMVSHTATFTTIEAIGTVGSYWDLSTLYHYDLAIRVVKQ